MKLPKFLRGGNPVTKGPTSKAEVPAETDRAETMRRGRAKAGAGTSTPDPKAPARKRRAPARKAAAAGTQARRAGAALSESLKEGTTETRGRTRAATPGAANGLLKLFGTAFGIFFDFLGFVLNILIAIGEVIAGPGMRLLRKLRGAVDVLSALLTPARALVLVVLGATVLLALSQYADYRVISTGSADYKAVELVAPAPEINREPTGDAHSYVFVPVAAACLLLLGGALRGRWRLCRLIAIAGLVAIVVALLIDRPAGLDLGTDAERFASVEATLLGGYYAQIFAGLLLAFSSLMLGRELRPRSATAGSKARRPDRKRRGLEVGRRRSPTEGAKA